MILKSLNISNYRLFETLDIEFDENLTLLVGLNGSGKTTILDAIAVALGTFFQPMENTVSPSINGKDARRKSFSLGNVEDVQSQYPVTIRASAMVEEEEVVWTRSLNSPKGKTTVREARELLHISRSCQERTRNGDPDVLLPIFVYYGTGRLWDYQKGKKSVFSKANTRTLGYTDSLEGSANVKLMLDWFRKMTIEKYRKMTSGDSTITELDAVCNAMEQCFQRISGFKEVKIQYNFDTGELDILYIDAQGRGMKLPLNQLSDGYKCSLSLVADIAYRMAVLNPQLKEQVLKETPGIVLIDEVDLHLHPQWQQRILQDLQDIFPKIQLIVTTHAPAVLSSAKSRNLRILSDGELLQVESQIYGEDANSILNRIMLVPERTPSVSALFDRFHELLDEKQYEQAEQILDEIGEKREYHDPKLAGCRTKLKLEKIRGGIR